MGTNAQKIESRKQVVRHRGETRERERAEGGPDSACRLMISLG